MLSIIMFVAHFVLAAAVVNFVRAIRELKRLLTLSRLRLGEEKTGRKIISMDSTEKRISIITIDGKSVEVPQSALNTIRQLRKEGMLLPVRYVRDRFRTSMPTAVDFVRKYCSLRQN
jgi:hypothetical protein